MIDKILQTIKNELSGKLAGQSELSNDKAEKASGTVTNTVKEEITQKAEKGQFDDIKTLSEEGGASSGFAYSLVNKVAGNLSGKVGLSPNVANKIAAFAVPFVIDKFKDLTASKGKDNKQGMKEMLGDLTKGSFKDKLSGGLGKKFGF